MFGISQFGDDGSHSAQAQILVKRILTGGGVSFDYLKKILSLIWSDKAPKYGDTSATYWKLYTSEAKINDNNFVENLKGNTDSMIILVRGDAHR